MKHGTLKLEAVPLVVEGVPIELSVAWRVGPKAPVLLLHGFGMSKEAYASAAFAPSLVNRPLLMFDAPGFGHTVMPGAQQIRVPFIASTVIAALDHFQLQRVHLVGHSMGGLVALLVAAAYPDRVLSFVNIEGNLVGSDCFFSRRIEIYPVEKDTAFLIDFIDSNRKSSTPGAAHYAANLRDNVQIGTMRSILQSMVDLSDNAGLLDQFIKLQCPRIFIFGTENASLPYLPSLQAEGITLAEIEGSGHFPMYSNPRKMWKVIGQAFDTL